MHTILGANGTIGKPLAVALARFTNKIRLVSRHPQKVNETDELYPADLADPTTADAAVAGSEVVYLLVGFPYKLKVWQRQWPVLMRAVLDACIRHGSKLVFFDNVYLYDKDAVPHMTEESPVNPPSAKGKVRQEVATMLLDEVKSGRLQAMIVRSADFYGPGISNSMLLEMVVKNLQKGKRPMWFGNPKAVHSFTYTPDAAEAVAQLANRTDSWNQTWHLPTCAEKRNVEQLTELFASCNQSKATLRILPRWMIRLLGLFIPVMREMPEMLYQYEQDYFFDSTRCCKLLNFTPTSYEEGVKRVMET